jgi:hypothetical protein
MTNSEAVAEYLFHGHVAALLARKANAVLVLDPFPVVRLAFATHRSPLARCGFRVESPASDLRSSARKIRTAAE